MTAAVHGPRVTQADRDAAWPMLREYVRPFVGIDWPGVMAGDEDDHGLVQAFARHREASQAELVEALGDALHALTLITERDGLLDDEMEYEGRARSVFTRVKARTDATGDEA